MVLVSGGGILPAIQGGVADAAGYLSSYWVVFICLGYLFFYAVIGSRNVNRNISVEDVDDVPLETAPQSMPVED